MSNAKTRNVFVLSTEYHFLLAMSIIDSHFADVQYDNVLVLKGPRLASIDDTSLPNGISAIRLLFEDSQFRKRLKEEVFGSPIGNLFVVHTYRAYESYVLSLASGKTRIHLMQDGSLFYHTMEVSLFLNRIRETYMIYKNLWDKGILLKTVLYYPRHMHRSRFINELWMTDPELFVDPKTKLKINQVKLFPYPESIERYGRCFDTAKGDFRGIEDCMIYLAPIIRNEADLPIEIEQIRKLKEKIGKKNLIIKLHPGVKGKAQFNHLQEAFGDVVRQDYIPAELYIANSVRSCVVGSASTALFYNNPSCQNFALKRYYQRLGIYAAWKNVALPAHVHQINELEDFDTIQIR